MQVSVAGAAVGALVGAGGRAIVVCFWVGGVGIIALPSAGVGLLVGAIAGALGKPLLGAGVGFVLSAFVFELFMCACASALGDIDRLFGRSDTWSKILLEVLPYTMLMGLAGAVAGGVGGLLAQLQAECSVSNPKPDDGADTTA